MIITGRTTINLVTCHGMALRESAGSRRSVSGKDPPLSALAARAIGTDTANENRRETRHEFVERQDRKR